jgi:hypothetical protein
MFRNIFSSLFPTKVSEKNLCCSSLVCIHAEQATLVHCLSESAFGTWASVLSVLKKHIFKTPKKLN